MLAWVQLGESLYRVHLRPIPQIYEFDHGTPHRFCRDMYVAQVPVMRLVAGIVYLLYNQIRHLSLHRGNVYGSQGGGTTANPFLCGVEGNTVVGMCSPV